MPQEVAGKSHAIDRAAILPNTAPHVVRAAWIADTGFTGIEFHPESYTALDHGRARFVRRPPGWYLQKKLRECYFFEDQPAVLLLSVHISDLNGVLIDDTAPDRVITEGR